MGGYGKKFLIKTGNFNLNGQQLVVLDGIVDQSNSSSDLLNAGITFDGIGVDTLNYAMIFVTVFSDVASATDGLMTQISSDNITWRDSDVFTIPANMEKTFSFQPNKRYFRIKYTNGIVNQAAFDLQTVLKKTNSKPSSHRIQDPISTEDDAELVKSVLTGQNPGGTFVNFQATTAGNFKTSLEELENNVSVNSNQQLKVTQLNSSGDEVDIIAHEDDISMRVVPGSDEVFRVHMNLQAIAATSAFMVIDLSDTVNWPHTKTGHIDILNILMNINPEVSPAFAGDISLGFLENVDADNGDLRIIKTWHLDRGATNINQCCNFSMAHYAMSSTKWFGPSVLNSTLFQTDVNLLGPDGQTVYPSGAGDLVLYVVRTANAADIGITIAYKTST